MTAVLRLDHIGKRYPGGIEALSEVSLRLAEGEFVSVVGPSGCGKSTLLRIAAGLERPSSGSVKKGTDHIGYLFQSPTLLPWRTVRANVELPLELQGVPRAERGDRATEAIELVGLTQFTGHKPGTLSGGMRMRVSLARTLAARPEALLLDEPLGALDEITRQQLGAELASLFAAKRTPALLVTHSIAEAVFLSTTVIVMSPRPGRVIARVDVPLPHPREPPLRHEPEFTALVTEVSGHLTCASS